MKDTKNELEYIRAMMSLFDNHNIVAMVGDAYDIFNFVKLLGSIKDEVIEKTSGGKTLVVRPDSGDPLTVPVEIVKLLMKQFGYTVNSKGYKVLPPYVRVIQGDGINEESLPQIVENMIAEGLSIDNIAFGMGGGLLQAWNRDTLKYAMKASARQDADGVWHDVFKDPITDSGKLSKKGRLGLIYNCGVGSCGFKTVPKEIAEKKGNILRTVFRDGELLVEDTFEEIRKRATLKEDEYVPTVVERY